MVRQHNSVAAFSDDTEPGGGDLAASAAPPLGGNPSREVVEDVRRGSFGHDGTGYTPVKTVRYLL